MAHQDLISVLIPAYNHERYVQEAIQSIIAQTYDNIELIVIDDGSPDNTWSKIQEMKKACAKRFSGLILERQSNHGVGYTFNRALELAKGQYVYTIASDDAAKPDALEILHDFLSAHKDYALAVGNNEIIDAASKRAYWDKKTNLVYNKEKAAYHTFKDFLTRSKHHIDFNSDDFGTYKSLLKRNYIPNGYLIRKDIFSKTGGYVAEAPLEDWYIMLQISKYAKMKYIDKILFSYRWHGRNTIRQTSRMRDYIQKTFTHEIKLVAEKGSKEIKRIMHDFLETNSKKTYINLGPLLQVYRVKNPAYKEYVIKYFNKEKRIKRAKSGYKLQKS